MSEKEIVIVSAVRTPIGKFNGSLKEISATQLGSVVIKEALQRSSIDFRNVDEVIMGNVLQAGSGQNPARQAAILAGLPENVPSTTINQVCGSGLKAVHLAMQSILSGESEVVVAGGMENMSQAPYLLKGAREGLKMGNQPLVDSLISDGLWCALNDYHMGVTAENLATKDGITRESQDEFASNSQQRAERAILEGAFQEEIVPISLPSRKGDPIVFEQDEFPRFGTTKEALGRLMPAFDKKGTVTAGNSSGINDGAAAVVLMSGQKAKELSVQPLVSIKANASVGVEPSIMGIGPVPAIRKLLSKTELTLDEVDLLELNEAFAAQSLSVIKELSLNLERVNVNGGAIALGHPIGASGTRILVTLIYELIRRNQKIGIAALCIGGGQGVASLVENKKLK
ncbi:acetyl-CoA C-acetyltransferase [Sporosarcina obsidiansis]|uniref:acetyl-CoA C-acetyltransferase n=1 Tax=Sporosarcina obsidiansis TaxID=2660748 RepID=UPI00129A38B9|nr:acetyl-CoA C-acetyltransferase [Sporosarcina obsidiansis]